MAVPWYVAASGAIGAVSGFAKLIGGIFGGSQEKKSADAQYDMLMKKKQFRSSIMDSPQMKDLQARRMQRGPWMGLDFRATGHGPRQAGFFNQFMSAFSPQGFNNPQQQQGGFPFRPNLPPRPGMPGNMEPGGPGMGKNMMQGPQIMGA